MLSHLAKSIKRGDAVLGWRASIGFLLCALLLAGCSMEGMSRKGGKSSVRVDRSVETEYKKALALLQSERYAEAERTLRALTESQPNLAGPYANLGIVYYRTDRLEKAEEAFRQSLKLNPSNPAAHNYLGVIHRTNGDFDKARADYTKALEIDKNYAEAHLNLGILYDLYLSDLNQALMHYRQYQSLAGQNDKQIAIWIADVEQRAQQNAQKGKAEAR